MNRDRPLLLSALDEVLRSHKELAQNHLDAYLDVYLAGANRNVGLDKLFTLCAKHTEDVEALVRKFEALLPTSSFYSAAGKKLPKLLNKFYVDNEVEPTNRAVFSPLSPEETAAMESLAELPLIPLKSEERLTFSEPLGQKTKELAPSYKARFLMAWLTGVPEGRQWRFPFWDEPTTIRFVRGPDLLIKNKGWIGVGWVEPYQYDLVLEQKGGFFSVVDHETMESRGAGLIQTLLQAK